MPCADEAFIAPLQLLAVALLLALLWIAALVHMCPRKHVRFGLRENKRVGHEEWISLS
jgi:hypothetical protein